MAVLLWDAVNEKMNGSLRDLLVIWHTIEGLGSPSIAKRLNEMGYPVEQRTVWRWLRDEGIKRGAK